MGTFKRFEEIEAWQKARQLTREVYAASSKGAFAKDFVLRDQLRRAGVSVMGNIAEGFERGGTREFVQFLAMAKASAGEVKSHLYVALDQGYLDEAEFLRISDIASDTGRVIGGLMKYLKSTGYEGPKYKGESRQSGNRARAQERKTRDSKLETRNGETV